MYILGNGRQFFNIDPILGTIQLKQGFHKYHLPTYDLIVSAVDNGNPPLFSNMTVQVNVALSSEVDLAPVFSGNNLLRMELVENVPIGTYLMTARAMARSLVTYEILKVKDAYAFSIGATSGIIVTQATVDYEIKRVYNFTVRASVSSGKYSDLFIAVHLVDINDNSPVLNSSEYFGHIKEDAAIGSLVLTSAGLPLRVYASDADSLDNGRLQYSIVGLMRTFSIDAATGSVKVSRALDRETVSKYEFYVSISDWGTPQLHSAELAKIVIDIDDVNDCTPVFKSALSAELHLPSFHGVVVHQAIASDCDSDVQLRYSLLSNGGGVFAINAELGVITVRTLPEQWLDEYELIVEVSDGLHTTIQVFIIKTTTVPSAGLMFSQPLYQLSVAENSSDVKVIGIVQTLGHELNEQVIYTILNPNHHFNISASSGVLRTTGLPADREVAMSYALVIEAKDRRLPPRIAHVTVLINVSDVNDNVPIFFGKPYHGRVTSTAKVGEVIMTVSVEKFKAYIQIIKENIYCVKFYKIIKSIDVL